VYRRAELLAAGWHGTTLTAAVRDGRLLRARGGCYLAPDAPVDVFAAVRIGGRLACVSVLARLGVFVRAVDGPHVHLARSQSRLRRPKDAARLHWRPLLRSPHPASACVEVFDALVQAIECQAPRDAVATVDSALHLGLLREDELDELFGCVSQRKRRLRRLVDGRAESGTETLVRLMVRALGADVRLQVKIDNVGRVDLLVNGWLVVECDSRAFHSSWDEQRIDRRRDQELARQGYVVYRPIAEDILHHPEAVIAALKGLLFGCRAVGIQARRA
jgi:very-short-patch-repair endonuclease